VLRKIGNKQAVRDLVGTCELKVHIRYDAPVENGVKKVSVASSKPLRFYLLLLCQLLVTVIFGSRIAYKPL
jgi:hypothetical protein